MRLPRFGARLYAIVSLLMAMGRPSLLVRLARGMTFGGAVTWVRHRCWMALDGGLLGW